MLPDDPRHGTDAGRVAHWRDGEKPCAPCARAAARAYAMRQLDAMRGTPRTVPIVGAVRRVRALQRIGWSAEHLSLHLGLSSKWLGVTLGSNQSGKISRANWERIASLYDEFSMTPGPSELTKARAIKAGWAPPLAWDDETIDNPRALPNLTGRRDSHWTAYDPEVVRRILAGERLPASLPERREVTRRWIAAGKSQAELERQTGWRVWRYVERAS